MGLISLPNVDEIAQEKDPKRQMEMMLNTMGILMKNLSELNGYISSKNVKEITADKISAGTIDTNEVTINTDLNSGGYIKIDANGMTVFDGGKQTFRVDMDGHVTMTAATVQSAAGYPSVVMDPAGQLFGAKKDANNYIEMNANYAGSPVINVVEGGSVRGQISSLSNKMRISGTGDMDVNASGDVVVTPGLSNFLRVSTLAKIFGTSEGKNLLAALGEKVNTTTAFSSYAVNMSFDPATRNLKLFAGNGSTLATVNIP